MPDYEPAKNGTPKTACLTTNRLECDMSEKTIVIVDYDWPNLRIEEPIVDGHG